MTPASAETVEGVVGPQALERPPLAELLTEPALVGALVGVVAGFARFGFESKGLVTACFLGALGVLSVIDFQRHLLPNRIVYPSAALVLGLQVILFPGDALESILAAVGCFAALLALALVKPGGIGMGDVKLGLLLGAGLGAGVVTAVFVGFLAMWPVALWVVAREGFSARKRALPLGPALAFGAAVVALAG